MSKNSSRHQQHPRKIGSFSGFCREILLFRHWKLRRNRIMEFLNSILGKYLRLKKTLLLFSPSLRSNSSLAERGERLLDSTLSCWLRGALPALPEEGVQVGVVQCVSRWRLGYKIVRFGSSSTWICCCSFRIPIHVDPLLFVSDPYPRGYVVVRFGSLSTWIRCCSFRIPIHVDPFFCDSSWI